MDRERKNRFLAECARPITAKQVVLSLLGSQSMQSLSSSDLMKAAYVFDIEPTSMRMATSRLVKTGILSSPDRGRYTIGPAGAGLDEVSRDWVKMDQRTTPWDGAWITVHLAHLGRVDRAAVRQRERALVLHGFAKAEHGLWVRPGNLAAPLGDLAKRMTSLGLEASSIFQKSSEIIGKFVTQPHELWDRETIETGYESALHAMQKSLSDLDGKNLKDRAEESLRIGSATIRLLTFDPLLPETLINTALREEVHRTMLSYDDAGQRAWSDYLSAS